MRLAFSYTRLLLDSCLTRLLDVAVASSLFKEKISASCHVTLARIRHSLPVVASGSQIRNHPFYMEYFLQQVSIV